RILGMRSPGGGAVYQVAAIPSTEITTTWRAAEGAAVWLCVWPREVEKQKAANATSTAVRRYASDWPVPLLTDLGRTAARKFRERPDNPSGSLCIPQSPLSRRTMNVRAFMITVTSVTSVS